MNILGTASHETRPFLESTRNISHKFLRRSKAESLIKLFQEFGRTESRILDALSKLDEFLLNPQIRMHSGTIPGTSRNINVENQGTNEDDSQSDPHPEAGIFCSQTTQNSGPEVGPDMVTGATEQMRNGLDLVTTVQGEIPYCSEFLLLLELPQENKRRPVPQVSHKFAVRTPL